MKTYSALWDIIPSHGVRNIISVSRWF